MKIYIYIYINCPDLYIYIYIYIYDIYGVCHVNKYFVHISEDLVFCRNHKVHALSVHYLNVYIFYLLNHISVEHNLCTNGVCVHIYIYIYIYMHTCTYMHTYAHEHTQTHKHIYVEYFAIIC